jgi:23S rRNA pseudouridine1911/1915/1917 synthase
VALTEKIPDALAGQRLDRVVSMIASCSRAQAVSLIEAGSVVVSGRVLNSKSYKVQRNQRIDIDCASLLVKNELAPDASVTFRTVFEDEELLVVDKPSGLVVHPGTGNETGTLVNGLVARYPQIKDVGQPERPGIVHRLDKSTSGLMVVAKTVTGYEALVEMMAEHQVSRTYTALVHGIIESGKGVIDAPIGRSVIHATQMALSASGKEAVTRYEVKSRFAAPLKATLVELNLETGRTHEIRVHMKAIGHPVVGDELYSRRRIPGLTRIFLHSSRISFTHPGTGQQVDLSSELPEELSRFLEGLQ